MDAKLDIYFPTGYTSLVFYVSLTISLYLVFAGVSVIVQRLMLSALTKRKKDFCSSVVTVNQHSLWLSDSDEKGYIRISYSVRVADSHTYMKSCPLLLPIFPQGPLKRTAGGKLTAATDLEEHVCCGSSKIIRKPKWGAWFPLWALTKHRTSVP